MSLPHRRPHRRGLPRRWRLAAALALAQLVAMVAVVPGTARAAAGDLWTLSGADPVAASISLSRFAFPTGAETAVLARSDAFPDALASGLLQDQGPLLLTETAALTEDTAAELRRLGVRAVTVLGGTAAVSEAVAESLREAGYRVSRLSGASRVDTAVAVASSRPAGQTVILARAFAGDGDPSQGFADALAAGAWSAASGHPVLLSETAVLSTSTAAYLRAAGVRTVMLVGGTAALGAQVEQELLAMGLVVRRISGGERGATAAAIAGAQGWDSSADVDGVVLVPARGETAWAAGFGAAALAADGRHAVLLADNDGLPVATRRFLVRGDSDLVCAPLLGTGTCAMAADELDVAQPVVGAFASPGGADQEHRPGRSRGYTVAVKGGGPVTVALAAAATSAAGAAGTAGWVLDDDGDGHADLVDSGAVVHDVDGARVSPAARVDQVRPSGGTVSFDVRAEAAAPAVRPVVFADLDGDGGLDVTGDGTPLEPASVGGASVWPPPPAAAGSHAGQVLTEAWPAFALARAETAAFRWTSADTFASNSGLDAPATLTQAAFEAQLGAGDTLAVNVGPGTTSRFTIVRDVPATPTGLGAVVLDKDGDRLPDVARVTWQRPPNTDLASSGTYVVERSAREADGRWGAWAKAADGAKPSTLSAEVALTEGEYRFRVLAHNSKKDVSAPGRPVVVSLRRPGAATPPVSTAGTFTTGAGQAETNRLLDAGDSLTVTFADEVRLAAGATIDLRDKDGTFVRLTRDGNAAFSLDETGTVLTVSVTGPPTTLSTSVGNAVLDIGELVVVESAAGVTNAAGAWNLPGSGWVAAGEARSRTVVGATNGLPAAVPDAKITADAGLDRITLAPDAGVIDTGDPFTVSDIDGNPLASGTYHKTNGATVTSTAFGEGQRLLVVYTDLSAGRLPSATASVLVGSPRPVLDKVQGANRTLTLVWSESVTLVGAAGLVEVFDSDDRVRVARASAVAQAGTDRTLVTLDTTLANGTYTVHVGAGLVRDAGLDVNDASAPALTTSTAAPTLAVTGGPAAASTVTTSSVTWTGTAADTVGVVTAIERRVDGGAWATTGVSAPVPDDSLNWSLTLTLSEGSHTVEVRAKDDHDAFSAVASRTITVNALAPTMTAAAVTPGAKTITVTFSEAVTCPDTANARAAWSFDDTVGANDGAGTLVETVSPTQCRITFGGAPGNFDGTTAGRLTYGNAGAGTPAGADRVVDGSANPLAAGSGVDVPASGP